MLPWSASSPLEPTCSAAPLSDATALRTRSTPAERVFLKNLGAIRFDLEVPKDASHTDLALRSDPARGARPSACAEELPNKKQKKTRSGRKGAVIKCIAAGHHRRHRRQHLRRARRREPAGVALRLVQRGEHAAAQPRGRVRGRCAASVPAGQLRELPDLHGGECSIECSMECSIECSIE